MDPKPGATFTDILNLIKSTAGTASTTSKAETLTQDRVEADKPTEQPAPSVSRLQESLPPQLQTILNSALDSSAPLVKAQQTLCEGHQKEVLQRSDDVSSSTLVQENVGQYLKQAAAAAEITRIHIEEEEKLPKKEEILRGRGRRKAKTVLTRYEDLTSGPYYLLKRSVEEQRRVKVWIRSAVSVRSICTGYVVIFDKHMNMALTDVDEIYRNPLLNRDPERKKKRKKKKKGAIAGLETRGWTIHDKCASPIINEHAHTVDTATEPSGNLPQSDVNFVSMNIDGTYDNGSSSDEALDATLANEELDYDEEMEEDAKVGQCNPEERNVKDEEKNSELNELQSQLEILKKQLENCSDTSDSDPTPSTSKSRDKDKVKSSRDDRSKIDHRSKSDDKTRRSSRLDDRKQSSKRSDAPTTDRSTRSSSTSKSEKTSRGRDDRSKSDYQSTSRDKSASSHRDDRHETDRERRYRSRTRTSESARDNDRTESSPRRSYQEDRHRSSSRKDVSPRRSDKDRTRRETDREDDCRQSDVSSRRSRSPDHRERRRHSPKGDSTRRSTSHKSSPPRRQTSSTSEVNDEKSSFKSTSSSRSRHQSSEDSSRSRRSIPKEIRPSRSIDLRHKLLKKSIKCSRDSDQESALRHREGRGQSSIEPNRRSREAADDRSRDRKREQDYRSTSEEHKSRPEKDKNTARTPSREDRHCSSFTEKNDKRVKEKAATESSSKHDKEYVSRGKENASKVKLKTDNAPLKSSLGDPMQGKSEQSNDVEPLNSSKIQSMPEIKGEQSNINNQDSASKAIGTGVKSIACDAKIRKPLEEVLERHINQLFIRGDNVVMVALLD